MAFKELNRVVSIPFLHWHREVDGIMKIIIDLFGLSLEGCFYKFYSMFDVSNVLSVARQLISYAKLIYYQSLMFLLILA
jgi:hypothetical protein